MTKKIKSAMYLNFTNYLYDLIWCSRYAMRVESDSRRKRGVQPPETQ